MSNKVETKKKSIEYDSSFSQADYDKMSKEEVQASFKIMEDLVKTECEKPRKERTIVVGDDDTFMVLRKILAVLEKTSYSACSYPLRERTRSGIILIGDANVIASPWGTHHTYQGVRTKMEEFAKVNKLKWTVGLKNECEWSNYYLEECDGVKISTSKDFPINRDIWEFGMRDFIKKDWEERCELEKK